MKNMQAQPATKRLDRDRFSGDLGKCGCPCGTGARRMDLAGQTSSQEATRKRDKSLGRAIASRPAVSMPAEDGRRQLGRSVHRGPGRSGQVNVPAWRICDDPSGPQ